MNYIIIAFRARTDTMKVADILKRYGVPYNVVNTPKEAMVGCGISVQIDAQHLTFVKGLLSRGYPASFVGFFRVERVGYRTKCTPIN